jgi:phage FluMu protein Com
VNAAESQNDHELRCSQCRMKIQQRDGDSLVIRNAILRVDLQTAQSYAKCPRCKTWNQVALHYTRSAVG